MKPLARVLLTVILGDSDWFEVLGVGLVSDACGEGRETVVVFIVVVPTGTVPSPCFNNKPHVAALIDFFLEVDSGSIMEVGLKWLLAVVPCPRWLQAGCCTSCSLLPRADGWPSLCWRLLFLRLPWPPLGVRLTNVVSPCCSDLES
jgi:hypothetical protein